MCSPSRSCSDSSLVPRKLSARTIVASTEGERFEESFAFFVSRRRKSASVRTTGLCFEPRRNVCFLLAFFASNESPGSELFATSRLRFPRNGFTRKSKRRRRRRRRSPMGRSSSENQGPKMTKAPFGNPCFDVDLKSPKPLWRLFFSLFPSVRPS